MLIRAGEVNHIGRVGDTEMREMSTHTKQLTKTGPREWGGM